MAWSSEDGWDRTRVTVTDCPRISEEFLEDERRSLGEFRYQQEFECEFFDPDTSVFSSDLIGRAISSEVQPLWSLVS